MQLGSDAEGGAEALLRREKYQVRLDTHPRPHLLTHLACLC